MARRRKTHGFSFSWKRAMGISATKGKLSRQIGIPLTRSGRQRAMGRALGCSTLVVPGLVSALFPDIVKAKILLENRSSLSENTIGKFPSLVKQLHGVAHKDFFR